MAEVPQVTLDKAFIADVESGKISSTMGTHDADTVDLSSVQETTNGYIDIIKEGDKTNDKSSPDFTYSLLESALFGELYVRKTESQRSPEIDNIGIRQLRSDKENPDARRSWSDYLVRHGAAFGSAQYTENIKSLKVDLVTLPIPVLAFLILYIRYHKKYINYVKEFEMQVLYEYNIRQKRYGYIKGDKVFQQRRQANMFKKPDTTPNYRYESAIVTPKVLASTKHTISTGAKYAAISQKQRNRYEIFAKICVDAKVEELKSWIELAKKLSPVGKAKLDAILQEDANIDKMFLEDSKIAKFFIKLLLNSSIKCTLTYPVGKNTISIMKDLRNLAFTGWNTLGMIGKDTNITNYQLLQFCGIMQGSTAVNFSRPAAPVAATTAAQTKAEANAAAEAERLRLAAEAERLRLKGEANAAAEAERLRLKGEANAAAEAERLRLKGEANAAEAERLRLKGEANAAAVAAKAKADANAAAPLPPGWVEMTQKADGTPSMKDGVQTPYYYNASLNKTQWERPTAPGGASGGAPNNGSSNSRRRKSRRSKLRNRRSTRRFRR
jgi:hypothetical protein